MIRISYVQGNNDSFKRAVLAALCLAEGDFTKLPKEVTESPMYADMNKQTLRAELGQLVGKINANLRNGNKR